ncbi:1-acyl-sn-glycerol-3-phosphate acyltransferase [Clostridium sp. MSJ-4]|uniref:1-acyl-sn-glycerol-3-phosphate acyltransferase n=1 Tax=Clostridium simiarum TaxID=2841506 RepID=A0ABS6EXY3_9CLOT|nr:MULTISPECIES: lysophospholipid acyltransferase family protein [Clostridium]MBU5590514.1 1-acyl-sn-glycerol-3-phosphate acyltransferase [Clostridium simiarum]
MRTFFIGLYYLLYMIIVGLKRIKFRLIRRIRGEEAAFQYTKKVVSTWAERTIKIMGMDVEISGRENIPKEACLFVGNHQSYFDIPIMIYILNKPIGFVAKKELAKIPVYRNWILGMKSLFLDRQNVREAIKTINIGIDYLKEGHSLAIFPEGTRSKSKEMAEFKKGSLKLAIKSQVPVVPVAISGTYKAFEETGRLKKATVKVKIDKPIYVKDLSKEEQGSLAEDVKEIIFNNLLELQ